MKNTLSASLLLLAATFGPGIARTSADADASVPSDCPDCPDMVVIPSGRFVIGSPTDEPGRAADEGPQREVLISRPFAMSRYEITRDQYLQFISDTGTKVEGGCITDRRQPFDWQPDAETTLSDPGYAQAGDHPVVCVSWLDAQDYVAWLNRRTGGGYRLPTEAEWEYAARAGAVSAYTWGTDVDLGCAYMNGTDLTTRGKYPGIEYMQCDDGALNTAAVGSYPANAFGLYDMTGNVGEWTASCKTADYVSWTADVRADGEPCERRVMRGGSWGTIPRQQRLAERMSYAPTDRDDSIGIRLVRDID